MKAGSANAKRVKVCKRPLINSRANRTKQRFILRFTKEKDNGTGN